MRTSLYTRATYTIVIHQVSKLSTIEGFHCDGFSTHTTVHNLNYTHLQVALDKSSMLDDSPLPPGSHLAQSDVLWQPFALEAQRTASS